MAAAATASCDELRERIESRIRANGVTEVRIVIVPSDDDTKGEVVGLCEGGRKRLLWLRKTDKVRPVITECADGRVLTSGDCRTGSRPD